jgi:hypothetical protein
LGKQSLLTLYRIVVNSNVAIFYRGQLCFSLFSCRFSIFNDCQQEFFQVDDYSSSGQDTEHGIASISWNESPFESAKIAVGTYSKIASVWTCDVGSKWREECVLGVYLIANLFQFFFVPPFLLF